MLISNGPDLVRLQCAFIDTPEVEKSVILLVVVIVSSYLLPEYVGDTEGIGNDRFRQ